MCVCVCVCVLPLGFLQVHLLEYVPRTSIDKMKNNCFKLAKERIRRYPAQTVMNAD